MPSLIDKAMKHFYMLLESPILCKHGNILLSLTLKENTISNIFTIHIRIHIAEIPKCIELSLKRKEEINTCNTFSS